MNWTKDLPTTPGWYWWRGEPGYNAKMVWVSSDQKFVQCMSVVLTPCFSAGGEWYGPVSEPQ